MNNCIFCRIEEEKILKKNRYIFCIRDRFPVTKDHCLLIPRRHFSSFFEIKEKELLALFKLINETRLILKSADPLIKGFNIGVNSGAAAGQTVFHCHIHLIPRREGDTENPAGGVRGVIPRKRNYLK